MDSLDTRLCYRRSKTTRQISHIQVTARQVTVTQSMMDNRVILKEEAGEKSSPDYSRRKLSSSFQPG
ncbi:hypothetical protein WG66_014267 [Moniliophthora roreri]|nr:hypothetical protein WG66_014267 [Moniliophthora roreri]